MNIEQRRNILNSKDYDFLKTNEHLGKNIILLCLGGSHAYGTSITTSDIDIRGVALNKKEEILLGSKIFEQVRDSNTDTTIYGFNKIINLLSSVNPSIIEMLGCRQEDYLFIGPIGRELINNRKMFLSKRVIHSFGGYATQQLRRLENKSNRKTTQSEQEAHILDTIINAMYDIRLAYQEYEDSDILLYVDKSNNERFDTEIFMDINLKHYPLRDYKSIWSEMNSIVKSYEKVGKRNRNAVEHGKLSKHMMHLMRIYMMCIDLLEKEEIITYRTKEHDLLMDIRNNKFLNQEGLPADEFYDLLNDWKKRFDYAKENTSLPEKPNYKLIEEFKMSVNERVVKNLHN